MSTRRKWRVARFSWQAAGPCAHCRKRRYMTRADAKRALRALYPADVGASMAVYHCADGGNGWHLGHRFDTDSAPAWPEWFDAEAEHHCRRCPAIIRIGEPAAWLHRPGIVICLDCGDLAERAVLAAS